MISNHAMSAKVATTATLTRALWLRRTAAVRSNCTYVKDMQPSAACLTRTTRAPLVEAYNLGYGVRECSQFCVPAP